MDGKLVELTLKGFKSVRDGRIDLKQANILIGANGSGKSNLIAFFRMLSHMLSSPSGALQRFVAENGGANALLFDGAKRTREIEASLVVESGQGRNDYVFRLVHASGDVLIFTEEKCRFSRHDRPLSTRWHGMGPGGHREAAILDRQPDAAVKTRATVTALLRGFVVYHFHDTSPQARVKTRWNRDDNIWLKSDAANLAPFLLRLRDNHPNYYRRIVETVRQVAPFLDDFVLEPDHSSVMLQWREQGADTVFSAYQASDGTLRAMALITALLQPPDRLPALLIIDEPELGLHPYAIAVVGGLIKAVAETRQVIVATQSPALLDQFDADDVVVVERRERATSFQRQDADRLAAWLDDYTLSELWHKNVLGGRPREGQG